MPMIILETKFLRYTSISRSLAEITLMNCRKSRTRVLARVLLFEGGNMRPIFLILTVMFMLATPTIQYAQVAVPAPPGSFAIEHVTVLNVETGARTADQTVVVTGNKIAAVGPSARTKAPSGARVI